MLLTEFIKTSEDQILREWVRFARTQLPAAQGMDDEALRDHGAELLRAVVKDMESVQSRHEQSEKGKGHGDQESMGGASAAHALARIESGFSLMQMASEYRALRASVIQLWERSQSSANSAPRDELTRFNEAIDQALMASLDRYTQKNDEFREFFLGMLSHDLRNPIGSIIMSASMMLRSEALDAKQTKAIVRIVNSAEKANRMVHDLLDLTRSRLGAGIPIEPVDMDLGETAQQAVNEIEALHPDRELRLSVAGDLRGQWDRDRFAQLVSNLVGNAVQHGAAGSPITITLRGEQDEVVLDVHNLGDPIPAQAMKRIFEPMVQQPGATSVKPSSSLGLGLYIVSEIVRAHQGAINVASGPKEGTTFTVQLPRQRQKGVRK